MEHEDCPWLRDHVKRPTKKSSSKISSSLSPSACSNLGEQHRACRGHHLSHALVHHDG